MFFLNGSCFLSQPKLELSGKYAFNCITFVHIQKSWSDILQLSLLKPGFK